MTDRLNYYDVIIVGAGIAGLYSAFNIKQMSPNTSFMVLEKYKKQWIGGRLNNEDFYGTTIVTGAGISNTNLSITPIDNSIVSMSFPAYISSSSITNTCS